MELELRKKQGRLAGHNDHVHTLEFGGKPDLDQYYGQKFWELTEERHCRLQSDSKQLSRALTKDYSLPLKLPPYLQCVER